MNPKPYLPIALAILIVTALVWAFQKKEKLSPLPYAASNPQTELESESTDPGYYEQWFESRKNKDGVIPEGLHAKWRAHDAKIAGSQKTTSRPFSNINFLGPHNVGGRTRAVMMDKGSQETMFAGGVQGGFWRSTNMGTSWSRVDDQAENLSVTCMTQNKFNPSVIYYGTGEANGSGNKGGGNGVFKSTDGGLTFTQLPATTVTANPHFQTVSCIEHDLVNPSMIYVGLMQGGLYRSPDNGATWNQVYSGGHVRDLVVFPDGSVLISHNSTGVFHSPSGNSGTFTHITDPAFPTSFKRIELAKSPSSPDTVYAMFETNSSATTGAVGFCRSADGGLTWTAMTTPTTGNTYSGYTFALEVHATDPNKVVAAAKSLQISHDGGLTWTTGPTPHADYHTFAVRNGDPDYFWAGNDGGVYKQNWDPTVSSTTNLNNDYAVTQFHGGGYHPVTDATIGGTQDNGTWKVDTGVEVKVGKNDGGHSYVHQQAPHIAYREWQGNPSSDGPIHMITDFNVAAPSNGTRINNDATMDAEGYDFLHFFLMNPANGYQLFSTTKNGVWRTNNTMASSPVWTKITNATSNIKILDCSHDQDPFLYIGGKSGGLQYMSHAYYQLPGAEVDLSSTLPSSVATDYIQALKVHPNNQNSVYVGFSTYNTPPRIWKLTGATSTSPTWHNVSGDLPSTLGVNSIAVDPWHPNDVLFVGTDFGVYYTENGGTNWSKVSQIPNTPVHEIKIRPSDRKIFIFTHGRGIWTLELNDCEPVTEYPYAEGFENDLYDGWYNSTNDQLNWLNVPGPTPTFLTGPSSAVEGNRFVYVEASSPNYPGKTARLLSPCYDITVLENPYIKWNYHMQGAHIGELKLDVTTDGGSSWTTIWSRSGDQGSTWQVDNYSLASYKLEHEVKFRFTATTGAGEMGDIALDHIEVVHSYAKSTGESPNSDDIALNAWPNPFAENFTIDAPANANAKVYSMTGTLIRSLETVEGENSLDMADLPKGNYLLLMEYEGKRKTLKMVKTD